MRKLAAISVLVCCGTASASPPEQPVPRIFVTPAPLVVALYDGHSAGWWAAQARRKDRHVKKLQRALRDRLPLAGGLASAFLCIHRFEGAWNDPNPPFWGGIQMNYGFAKTYGPEFLQAWGTPDHWPPFIQVAVGIRAYLSGRRFEPWPTTSRMCGLR